jgi:hypothetical protein
MEISQERAGLAQRFSCKERDMHGRKSPSVRALASVKFGEKYMRRINDGRHFAD